MMASRLFSPLTLRELTLANRIVVSPMCQHSAQDGIVGDWHAQHLGSLAVSNAGLVVIESTAVERDGRISHGCVGLWSDETEAALGGALAACRRIGNAAFGIQLSHSGRKGSSQRPWEGGRVLHKAESGWTNLAPSSDPFDEGGPLSQAMEAADFDRLVQSFASAARRADRIGIDVAELHTAHGYLLHNFLSPISNRRSDQHGGSLENRMRFPLRVFEAVRAAWPEHKPLGARITATDWLPGGITIDEAVRFATELKARGCDFICVTSGGIVQKAPIPYAPAYMAPFAETIRREVGIPTRAVGYITSPHEAEAVLENEQADMVAIGRAFLDDPRWVWHAARALGADVKYVPQYEKTRPAVWRKPDAVAATA